MGDHKVFELCHDGFHCDCVVIEYEGHRMLASILDNEYIKKFVNHEFTRLEGPFTMLENLPCEYWNDWGKIVFRMKNGSLKTLYIYNHACPGGKYENSNAAAIAYGLNGGKLYGNVIAEFE
jgi:hypothetical protein